MPRCLLMTIPTRSLLPTSLPQRLSHIRQLGNQGQDEGVALQNQTVFHQSTHFSRLRQNRIILLTLSTSNHLLRYWLYFLLIGRWKGLGEYGKALTALTSTRSSCPQSLPLSDHSSLRSWRYLTLDSHSRHFRQSPTPAASIYYLPLHRWPR